MSSDTFTFPELRRTLEVEAVHHLGLNRVVRDVFARLSDNCLDFRIHISDWEATRELCYLFIEPKIRQRHVTLKNQKGVELDERQFEHFWLALRIVCSQIIAIASPDNIDNTLMQLINERCPRDIIIAEPC